MQAIDTALAGDVVDELKAQTKPEVGSHFQLLIWMG